MSGRYRQREEAKSNLPHRSWKAAAWAWVSAGSVAKNPQKETVLEVRPHYFTAAIVVFVVSLFAFAWGTLEQRQRPGASVGSVAEADMEAMRACGEMEVVSQEKTQCLVDVAMEIGRRDDGRWQSWQQALDTLDAYVVEAEFKYGHHVTHYFFVDSKLDRATMQRLDFDRRDIGFVHGWTEWYLGQREHYGQEREIYDMLCRPEKNRDLKEDCAHGFGHVAYQQDLGGFEDRVAFCNALGGYAIDPEAEIGQCYAGLLMSHGPPGASEDETGNERPGGPLPRISKETAADLCRQASQVAAERCWPWVVWYYYGEEDALDEYFAVCDTSGEASRWCGAGVARYLFFILREQEETLYQDVMETCMQMKGDDPVRRGTKVGCAIEVVRIDIEDWWRDGNRTYREFPCSSVRDDDGICAEAVEAVFSLPCEVDQDVEWMDVCLRNRKART